jgi:hypothetical protein
MRLAAAAVTVLLLTGTAHAQINLFGAGEKAVDSEVEAKQRELDKAYREKTRQIAPAQAPVNDPWGNVRASEKPAQSKAQAGSKKQ